MDQEEQGSKMTTGETPSDSSTVTTGSQKVDELHGFKFKKNKKKRGKSSD